MNECNHAGFYGGALTACCGGGGPYNFNTSAYCGQSGSTVCKDPSAFVDWDGIHSTESAYHYIARGLIDGGFISPPLLFQFNYLHYTKNAVRQFVSIEGYLPITGIMKIGMLHR